ncbi:D-hexose-6-phosphate mutarotase [Undibacterium sp. YM2]|jgi:glucose-6-phosphate 1-epimerase|uniref:D-hexose-6-phosphate mutarotase n=1 Tax=Undibacterium sp. YM2 TaxID=2058625 RepID=UPI001331DA36|nr:D-hexose-6-phosphate mutarotase [Undibacterium sp. YM2]BBB69962.1 D-hexose-6-phosphate mutarotase [Undibacterium sp. YM2]
MNFLSLTSQDGATAKIASQGAHLCSWIPAGGVEQLFMSKTSAFLDGVAIRGGVPVVFPQFSNQGTLPKHGFARTCEWKLLQSGLLESGAAQAVYELKENIARLTIWPYVFRAELRVSILGNSLQIVLDIHNTGDTNFSFSTALHTYLAVQDIADVSLHGLQGLYYRDTVTGADHCLEAEPSLHITGETDRIYGQVPAQLELRQPQQSTLIRSSGFADAVVWNPGAGAAKINDLHAGGENNMLCVEAATILRPIMLAPGDSWSGSQTLEVKSAHNPAHN